MTREEFIFNSVNSGYSSKKVAEKYAGNRTSFEESDYVGVHRMNEEILADKYKNDPRFRYYQGVRTTKHLKYINPDNWNPKK